MDAHEHILEELQLIRQQLAILVMEKAESAKKFLQETHLKTEQQQKIYECFDGKTSAQEIATKLGVTPRYVNQLISRLESLGFVIVTIDSGQRLPKRIV